MRVLRETDREAGVRGWRPLSRLLPWGLGSAGVPGHVWEDDPGTVGPRPGPRRGFRAGSGVLGGLRTSAAVLGQPQKTRLRLKGPSARSGGIRGGAGTESRRHPFSPLPRAGGARQGAPQSCMGTRGSRHVFLSRLTSRSRGLCARERGLTGSSRPHREGGSLGEGERPALRPGLPGASRGAFRGASRGAQGPPAARCRAPCSALRRSAGSRAGAERGLRETCRRTRAVAGSVLPSSGLCRRSLLWTCLSGAM